jgi:hypothetical protein
MHCLDGDGSDTLSFSLLGRIEFDEALEHKWAICVCYDKKKYEFV